MQIKHLHRARAGDAWGVSFIGRWLFVGAAAPAFVNGLVMFILEREWAFAALLALIFFLGVSVWWALVWGVAYLATGFRTRKEVAHGP